METITAESKRKILSKIDSIMDLNQLGPSKKIDKFNDYVQVESLDYRDVLKYLREHEEENPMEPYHSFLCRQEIKKPSMNQVAKEFIRKEFIEKASALIYMRGDFLSYDGKKYSRIDSERFEARVLRFVNKSWILRKERATSVIQDIVVNLKSIAFIERKGERPFWLEGREDEGPYIPVENGIFSMKRYLKGEQPLQLHSPNFICEYCLPFEYHPQETSVLWEMLLDEIFEGEPGKIEFIQEWSGHLLTPDTSQEKFLIMFGAGANGKSVILNVLMTLIGMENISTIGLDTFSQQRTFLLASTIGKLANISTDLNEVKRAAEGLLKKFISGEHITIEEKYKAPYQVKPYARLIFATNIPPRFMDRSNGIERRLIFLTFNKQFLDEKKQQKEYANPNWWIEKNELPGIFNWALVGLSRLLKRGHFKLPQEMLEDKKRYLEECNPTLTFIKNYFELSPGNSVAAIVAYKNYVLWMKENGYRTPLSQVNFSRELKKVFPTIQQTKSMRVVTTSDDKMKSRLWEGITMSCDE